MVFGCAQEINFVWANTIWRNLVDTVGVDNTFWKLSPDGLSLFWSFCRNLQTYFKFSPILELKWVNMSYVLFLHMQCWMLALCQAWIGTSRVRTPGPKSVGIPSKAFLGSFRATEAGSLHSNSSGLFSGQPPHGASSDRCILPPKSVFLPHSSTLYPPPELLESLTTWLNKTCVLIWATPLPP
jgi:hypothetical protein